MGTLLTLARKDLRLLFRDRFGMFWIFAFPLMYAGFFGMIFGSDDDSGGRGRLALAIVDDDHSDAARRLIGRLAAHASLSVERQPDDANAVLLRSLEDAAGLVRRGKRVAYLRLPQGFGADPFAMFRGGDDAVRIELGIDPARTAEKGILQGILMENLFASMSDTFKDKGAMKGLLERGKGEISRSDDLPLPQKLVLGTFLDAVGQFFDQADIAVLEQGPGGLADQQLVDVLDVTRDTGARPHSAFEITFPQSMVWGLMGVALGFAITIVRERTQGTLLRLRMAPLGSSALLAGKSLACFATCLITMVVLLTFGVVVLGIRIGSPGLLLLAMLATSFCFTGIMMTASVMGRTEQAVAGAAWGTMMPFAMIGGGMIPLIAMPGWMVTASNFSPFKWAIYSMEGAIWRDFSLAEMAPPCAILVAIGVGVFGLGLFIYRKQDL